MSTKTGKWTQKVLVLGSGGIGKTTLIKKYMTGKYGADTSMTIGVQFHSKKLTTGGIPVDLMVWDIGGQEQFKFMRTSFYNGAKAAIIGFDLSRYQTFLEINDWYKDLEERKMNIPTILIGTKADMERGISWEEASKFAADKGVDYFETSAKSNLNVEAVFIRLAHLSLYESHNKQIPDFLSNYSQIYQNEMAPYLAKSKDYKFSPLLFTPVGRV